MGMTSDNRERGDARADRRTVRMLFFAALGLAASGIAAGLLVREFRLGWIGVGLMMLVLMGGIAWLMRFATRRSAELGCASPAMLRYNRRMLVWSMVYMVGFFAGVLAYKRFHVEGPLLWAAGLAPSIGVCGMIWSGARLIVEETDEYLRFRIVKQALFALSGLLVFGTVWGFLEQFRLVPHIPLWIVMPIFAVLLGLGNCFRWVRT